MEKVLFLLLTVSLFSCQETYKEPTYVSGEEPMIEKYVDFEAKPTIIDTVKEIDVETDGTLLNSHPIKTVGELNDQRDRALTLLIQGSNLADALFLINEVIDIDPNNANDYYIRGNIFQKQLDYISALGNYKKAIEINPNHRDAIMKCGIIYGKLSNLQEACKYFSKACELGDNDACLTIAKFCK